MRSKIDVDTYITHKSYNYVTIPTLRHRDIWIRIRIGNYEFLYVLGRFYK